MANRDILNQGLNTTQNLAYIVCIDTGKKLDLQFIPLGGINQNRRIDQGEVRIIGRNVPEYHYTGGTYKIDFTLDFVADEESRSSVIQKVRWLEALSYSNSKKAPKPRIHFIFGDLYKNHIWNVENVKSKLSLFDKRNGLLPTQATVDLSLCLDVDLNPDWNYVNPEYPTGEPDGSYPVDLGTARASDEQPINDFTNDNSLETMLQRLLDRLRIIPPKYDYRNYRYPDIKI